MCIALPPADGNFFGGTCPDCRALYSPTASVVQDATDPDWLAIIFHDAAALSDGGSCGPCAVRGGYDRKLVSTYTFKALKDGTTEFVPNPECTATEPCIPRPPVPTFSGIGIGLFALMVALCFILIARRVGKSASRSSALSLVLVLGITLSVGVFWSDVSQALPVCPEECSHLNLDVNKDGNINAIDFHTVQRCIKASSCDPATVDVNGDGIINWDDYKALVQCFQKGCVKANQ